MNELYGLPDIPDTTFVLAHHTDPVFRNAVDSSVRIDPATIARLTARIYKGDLDTSQDLDRDFYQAVASVMHEAVDKGLKEAGAHAPSSPDDYFHHQLNHSSDVFAAFKVHRAQADIAAQLLDDDGHLRPFREFQQRVLPITSHQCGRWLRTEYDTAVIRAQRAAEWQQFLEEADVLPNLEWMPSTSANPGADHQVFWGTILPISDPFWSEHRPGDRWNCKCSLQATDAKPTPRPRGFSEIANAPQPGLDTNPGTDGAVFSPSHPYFPTSCSQCPFKAPAAGATVPEGFPEGSFTNQAKDCMHCAYANACINNTQGFDSITIAYQDQTITYEGRDWCVDISSEQGHLFIDPERIAQAMRSKQEREKFEKERGMNRVIVANGHNVEHMSDNKPEGTYDIYIDRKPADLKKVTGKSGNIVKYARHALLEQGAEIVIFSFPEPREEYTEALQEAFRKLWANGTIMYYYECDKILHTMK